MRFKSLPIYTYESSRFSVPGGALTTKMVMALQIFRREGFAYHRRIAHRSQYALPAVEDSSFENRPRRGGGCVILSSHLRGAIVNRTYGTDKNLYRYFIYLPIFTINNNIWSYLMCGP